MNESKLTKAELVDYLKVFHGKFADEFYEKRSYDELLKMYIELYDSQNTLFK